MTNDPQIIAWIPKTGDDTKPGESFSVFAQQTPRGRYYFLALDGDILVTLNSSYAAYMAGSVRADIAKNADVDPEDFADTIRYEDSRIIIRSGFDESGDQVFEVDTHGHLPYVYALGLLEAAKDTIKETYTEDEEERGRRMTDEAKEIIDLARKRDHHHKGLNETSRELAERNLGRNDEVHPLEGEIWHVVLTARGCARTVVPAIKGIIGWYVTPTSVESTLYDDCHIASRHVYPVERIAESPTVNHKEN